MKISSSAKIIGVLGGAILLSVLFLEASERRGSALKSFLYDEAHPDTSLKVATVAMQVAPEPEKNQSKLASITEAILARHPAVELIVFGEVILGWFRSEPSTETYHRQIAEPVPGPTTEIVAGLAREHQVYITFGISELSGGEVFNSQVLVDPDGEIVTVQRKKNLKNSAFSPGQTPITFVEIKDIRIGLVICFDARSKETARLIREADPEMLILSLADYTDEWDKDRFALGYGSRLFGAWIVTANRFGDEGGTHWDGHIEILNPLGDILASGQSREQFIYHEVAFDQDASGPRAFLRMVYSRLSLVYFILRHINTAFGYVTNGSPHRAWVVLASVMSALAVTIFLIGSALRRAVGHPCWFRIRGWRGGP